MWTYGLTSFSNFLQLSFHSSLIRFLLLFIEQLFGELCLRPAQLLVHLGEGAALVAALLLSVVQQLPPLRVLNDDPFRDSETIQKCSKLSKIPDTRCWGSL